MLYCEVMTMKTSKPLSLLLSLLTALAVLSGSIAAPLLCRPFYYAHIDALGLVEYTGLTREQITEAFDQMMDYCLGQTYKDATGFKAILCNPFVATVITVVLGVGLGMTGYSKIWPLFGAANQLLAALALLTVCAWLGNIGRNNKMFYIPMAFMLVVTLTSLVQTITTQAGKIMAAGGMPLDLSLIHI